ncbi:MAG: hypothetical protein PHQ36_04430 [Anaerolineales bacterium]|nr:hypothetical protein [Anaerolineales bacterium]
MNMIAAFIKRIRDFWFRPILEQTRKLENEAEKSRVLLGNIYLESIKKREVHSLADVEMRVFSQWGEDGIIQYLISKVPIAKKEFVEFGVEDYRESNTRFLLINNNWDGLVIDCSEENVQKIAQSELSWRYNLKSACSFVTKDNICDIIRNAGISGDIGLLSVDIDGNDYWIWDVIGADTISPRIVIVEYNSVFGREQAITIPYDEKFSRSAAHFSNLYYGASLKALYLLAKKKGYIFVGANSAGNNAFFVRKDVAGGLTEMDVEHGYVESKFREARDKNGRLVFLSGSERKKMLDNLEVYDVQNNALIKL